MVQHYEVSDMVERQRRRDQVRAAERRRLVALCQQSHRSARRRVAAQLGYVLARLSARLLQYAQIDRPVAFAGASDVGRAS